MKDSVYNIMSETVHGIAKYCSTRDIFKQLKGNYKSVDTPDELRRVQIDTIKLLIKKLQGVVEKAEEQEEKIELVVESTGDSKCKFRNRLERME